MTPRTLLQRTALALVLAVSPVAAQDVEALRANAAAAAEAVVDAARMGADPIAARARFDAAIAELADVDPDAAAALAAQLGEASPAVDDPLAEAPVPEDAAAPIDPVAPVSDAADGAAEIETAPEAELVPEADVAPAVEAEVAPAAEVAVEDEVPVEVEVVEPAANEAVIVEPETETVTEPEIVAEPEAEATIEPEAEVVAEPAVEPEAAIIENAPAELPASDAAEAIEGDDADAVTVLEPTAVDPMDAITEAEGLDGEEPVEALVDPVIEGAPVVEGTAEAVGELPTGDAIPGPVVEDASELEAEVPADDVAEGNEVPLESDVVVGTDADTAIVAEEPVVEPGANDTDVIAAPADTAEAAEQAVLDAEAALAEARESGEGIAAARARLRAARFDRATLDRTIVDADPANVEAESVEVVPGENADEALAPVTEAGVEATIAPAPTVLPDEISDAERELLATREELRREQRRRRRAELIGAAAAGVAVGAIVPQLGGRVVEDAGDRIVVERDGELFVRRDENELLRDRADRVEVIDLGQGVTETQFFAPDGARVITVRDAGGQMLRRSRIRRDGTEVVLFDNTFPEAPREAEIVYDDLPPVIVPIPQERYVVDASRADELLLEDTFVAEPVEAVERRYTLSDVRQNERLRDKVRRVDLDQINFDTGSAAVRRSQLPYLDEVGIAMVAVIEENPAAVFLVEGHTDAVGGEVFNLTLSDRRAETVAALLIDRYGVPPENLVVEGYGERFLKVDTEAAERANRRVTVRNITPLVSAAR